MAEPPLIEIRDLSIGFRSRGGTTLEVLRNSDLQASRGETVGLVGECGSGKSTLALAAMGYLRLPAAFDGVPPPPSETRTSCAFADRCVLAVDRCRTDRPNLNPVPTGERVRCHFFEEAACLPMDGRESSGYAPAGEAADGHAREPVLELSGLSISYARPGLIDQLLGRRPDNASVARDTGRTLHPLPHPPRGPPPQPAGGCRDTGKDSAAVVPTTTRPPPEPAGYGRIERDRPRRPRARLRRPPPRRRATGEGGAWRCR